MLLLLWCFVAIHSNVELRNCYVKFLSDFMEDKTFAINLLFFYLAKLFFPLISFQWIFLERNVVKTANSSTAWAYIWCQDHVIANIKCFHALNDANRRIYFFWISGIFVAVCINRHFQIFDWRKEIKSYRVHKLLLFAF
jgi:hypothetical protein